MSNAKVRFAESSVSRPNITAITVNSVMVIANVTTAQMTRLRIFMRSKGLRTGELRGLGNLVPHETQKSCDGEASRPHAGQEKIAAVSLPFTNAEDSDATRGRKLPDPPERPPPAWHSPVRS